MTKTDTTERALAAELRELRAKVKRLSRPVIDLERGDKLPPGYGP